MPSTTSEVLTLTRQELYEQVWTTPMTKLAAMYKLLDRHDIPRPPRGHWAKLQFGKASPRAPLPPCDDPRLQSIQLGEGDWGKPDLAPMPPNPEYDEDVIDTLKKAIALPPVTVATSLRGLHHLVQATREALDSAKPGRDNLLFPWRNDGAKTLSVAVSKASVRRSLLFLDALIKGVERIGGTVEVDQGQWTRETIVSFCRERVCTIRLRERCRRVPREKPASKDWYSPRHDLIATGRLVLESNTYGGVHCQDSEKRRRIEDTINELIIKWVSEAGRLRIARRQEEAELLEREAKERERREREAELQRQRYVLQQKQIVEQARVDNLLADAESWRKSLMLREYISQVREFVTERDGAIEQGGELERWLKWADDQADRLDPFSPSPPSVLDERI